jgi:hypothetical protein
MAPRPAPSRPLPPAKRRSPRWFRIVVWTGLTLLLGAGLVVLLSGPFYHPRTHLTLLTGDIVAIDPTGSQPAADYVADDLRDWLSLAEILHANIGESRRPLLIAGLREAEIRRSLADRWNAQAPGVRDVLLVYVSAQGVAIDGQARLAAPGANPEGFLASNLLRQLRECKAGTKLLLLDAGRVEYQPEHGLLENSFVACLQKEIAELADPALWVLVSHRDGQRSHLTPGLRRSVFAHALISAFRGAADANADQALDLVELQTFVSQRVARQVNQIAADQAEQTPLLLRSKGDPLAINPRLAAITKPLSKPNPGDGNNNPSSDQSSSTVASAAEAGGDNSLANQAAGEISDEAREEFNQTIIGAVAQSTPQGRFGSAVSAAVRKKLLGNKGGETAAADPQLSPATTAPDAPESSPSAPPPTDGGKAPSPSPADAKVSASPAVAATPPTAKTQETVSPKTAGASGTEPPPDIAALLDTAWRMRDELAARNRLAARPIDYAPDRWSAVENSLLALDRKHRTGFVRNPQDLAQAITQVQGELTSLAGLAPGRALVTQGMRSLALLEFRAREANEPLSTEQQAKIAAFDRLLATGARPDLVAFAAALTPADDQYLEFRQARIWSTRNDLDWSLIQLWLRIVREGEQAACASRAAESWAGEALAAADQERHAVERILSAPTVAGADTLIPRLDTVLGRYSSVRTVLQDVQRAERDWADVVQRLPAFFAHRAALAAAGERSQPATAQLSELLVALEQLGEILARPSPHQWAALRTAAARFTAARSPVEAPWSVEAIERLVSSPLPPGAVFQGLLLLESPLLTSDQRRLLVEAVREIDAEQLRNPPPSAAAPANTPLTRSKFLADQHELEWLRIRALASRTQNPDVERLQSLAASVAESPAANLYGPAVRDVYQNLPGRLVRAMQDLQATAGDRRNWLIQLSHWDQSARLLFHPLPAAKQVTPPGSQRIRAELFDLLVWQAERFRRAQEDQPPLVAAALHADALALDQAAAAIPAQPQLPPSDGAALRLTGDNQAALVDNARATATFTLQADFAGPVWLVAEFDPALLALDESGPLLVYPRHELPPAELAKGLGSAVRALRTSANVSPGRPLRIDLPLRRLAPSVRDTLLVLRAVSGERSARFDLSVALARPEGVQLAVTSVASAFTPSITGGSLHPFPNRTSTFGLQVTGLAPTDEIWSVALHPLLEPLAEPLPAVLLKAEHAAQLLASVPLAPPIGEAKDLPLKPGEPTRVVLKPPVPPKPEAPPAAPGGTSPQPAAQPAVSAPPRLDHGVLVKLTRADGVQVLKLLSAAPQRPQRYLRATAGYSTARRRAEVVISPIDPTLLPSGGVTISAAVREPLPPAAERKLQGILTADAPEVRLFVEAPRGPGLKMTLELTVDDYPRAFTFVVPCDSDQAEIAADDNQLGAAILSPAAGDAFSGSLKEIPVKLRVDAPLASARQSPLSIEIGLDRNRDRELIGEPTVKLLADRQVAVTFAGLSETGALQIQTQVTDYELKIPTLGLDRGRANVLARVGLGDRVAWSAPAEIALDSAPPQMESLRLAPSGRVAAGDKLELSLLADDAELSGVARVEALFDLARSGEFGPKAEPLIGAQRADGRWAVTLPADAPPGGYNILVRAVDRVGNASSPLRVPVQIISKEDAAAEKLKASLATIEGAVFYGPDPVAGAQVLLFAGEVPPKVPGQPAAPFPDDTTALAQVVADKDGLFRFKQIPPGAYRVAAKGKVKNKNRIAEAGVKFAIPQEVSPLRIALP